MMCNEMIDPTVATLLGVLLGSLTTHATSTILWKRERKDRDYRFLQQKLEETCKRAMDTREAFLEVHACCTYNIFRTQPDFPLRKPIGISEVFPINELLSIVMLYFHNLKPEAELIEKICRRMTIAYLQSYQTDLEQNDLDKARKEIDLLLQEGDAACLAFVKSTITLSASLGRE